MPPGILILFDTPGYYLPLLWRVVYGLGFIQRGTYFERSTQCRRSVGSIAIRGFTVSNGRNSMVLIGLFTANEMPQHIGVKDKGQIATYVSYII